MPNDKPLEVNIPYPAFIAETKAELLNPEVSEHLHHEIIATFSGLNNLTNTLGGKEKSLMFMYKAICDGQKLQLNANKYGLPTTDGHINTEIFTSYGEKIHPKTLQELLNSKNPEVRATAQQFSKGTIKARL